VLAVVYHEIISGRDHLTKGAISFSFHVTDVIKQ
jgi:hypothetical protein